MKIVTKYECDICHTRWDEKKLASGCEGSHRTAEGAEVMAVYYSPRPDLYRLREHTPHGLPGAVRVCFPDGKEGHYVYQAPQGV